MKIYLTLTLTLTLIHTEAHMALVLRHVLASPEITFRPTQDSSIVLYKGVQRLSLNRRIALSNVR